MNRRALIAKVHIAKKQLVLDDDVYRQVLERVTGRRSAGDIDDAGLVSVLAEFRRLGWQPASNQTRPPRSRNPHVRKVWAVWKALCLSGAVRSPTRAALRAFVLSQTEVSDPEWLTPEQANQVIEALKAWRVRHLRSLKSGG